MNTLGPFLTGSYHYRLVALSVFIAILASYAALDLAGRVTSAKRAGPLRSGWLAEHRPWAQVFGACTTSVCLPSACRSP